jgi:hypothetical protein
MTRLLRWTVYALAAASLLLCVATAAVWVRSYWVLDIVLAECSAPKAEGQDFGTPRYGVFAESHGGQFAGWFGGAGHLEPDPTSRWSIQHSHETTGFATFPSGLKFEDSYVDYDGVGFNLHFWRTPGWAFASAFAVLPLVLILRHLATARRRRRARLGCCPACGYDLRATPDRCPECGKPGEGERG